MDAGCLLPVHEESRQTRLGRGFYDTHILLPEAIAQTAQAVSQFADVARSHLASTIRVIATSAAREAVNREQLLQQIEGACGLSVEVISGEEEAELVFRGVATDEKLREKKLLILDVGGGSTEFIVGESGHHTFCQSFGVGTVRLLEKLRPSDPPLAADLHACRSQLRQLFAEKIGPVLYPVMGDRNNVTLVGTGGTTTILARMEKQLLNFARDEIEGTLISFSGVRHWMERLWVASIEDRKRIAGIPANRADIIPMGVAIYEVVMESLNLPSLFVSTRGLRFGALMGS